MKNYVKTLIGVTLLYLGSLISPTIGYVTDAPKSKVEIKRNTFQGEFKEQYCVEAGIRDYPGGEKLGFIFNPMGRTTSGDLLPIDKEVINLVIKDANLSKDNKKLVNGLESLMGPSVLDYNNFGIVKGLNQLVLNYTDLTGKNYNLPINLNIYGIFDLNKSPNEWLSTPQILSENKLHAKRQLAKILEAWADQDIKTQMHDLSCSVDVNYLVNLSLENDLIGSRVNMNFNVTRIGQDYTQYMRNLKLVWNGKPVEIKNDAQGNYLSHSNKVIRLGENNNVMFSFTSLNGERRELGPIPVVIAAKQDRFKMLNDKVDVVEILLASKSIFYYDSSKIKNIEVLKDVSKISAGYDLAFSGVIASAEGRIRYNEKLGDKRLRTLENLIVLRPLVEINLGETIIKFNGKRITDGNEKEIRSWVKEEQDKMADPTYDPLDAQRRGWIFLVKYTKSERPSIQEIVQGLIAEKRLPEESSAIKEKGSDPIYVLKVSPVKSKGK